jgi:Na+/H+ antiporter NhaD/arsenite permease-like protein
MEIFLLLAIVFFFYLMVTNRLSQEVAVPLLALTAMLIAGAHAADDALKEGIADFARVAIIFTAVAVPAKQLLRSKALDKQGLFIGEFIGRWSARLNIPLFVTVPIVCLFSVYATAALFHNTTSILVCTPLIFLICRQYNISPRYIVCGALVASNLGGFSTRWGDTPNIVEAKIWGLTHSNFFLQILPVNLGFIVLLCAFVILLTKYWGNHSGDDEVSDFDSLFTQKRFNDASYKTAVDHKLSRVAYTGLIIAIGTSIMYPEYEILGAGAAIIVCILLDPKKREETLQALGLKTYLVIFSVFILARILSQSGISIYLKEFIAEGGILSILLSSYVGTMFTEAASWAAAASPLVFAHSQGHAAAWALGGGICAGSSSLLTAATAGILLSQVTQDMSEENQVSFSSYFFFGIGISLLMLIYYAVVLTVLQSLNVIS